MWWGALNAGLELWIHPFLCIEDPCRNAVLCWGLTQKGLRDEHLIRGMVNRNSKRRKAHVHLI